jgi:hypothetical protein
MPRLIKAPEALDVDVKEFAWPVAFISHWWRRSIELLKPAQPGRATDAGRR